MPSRGQRWSRGVFLNVPFDETFEPLFVALVSSVVALGRTPRCVLEIPEDGQGRLVRILSLIRNCRTSIHDLSREEIPARFNMPFEVGIAFALSRLETPRHRFIVMESEKRRLKRTLNDLDGLDALCHENEPQILIARLLSTLGKRHGNPLPRDVITLHQEVWKMAVELKRAHLTSNIYSRALFCELVAGATKRASELRLLKP